MLDVNDVWIARVAELCAIIEKQQGQLALALGVLAALGFDMLDFSDSL